MTIQSKVTDGADEGFRERALLQTWFSPAFPIGSFAYSQGLERAAEGGLVADADALLEWIVELFAAGSVANDLAFMTCAWRAVAAGDWPALAAAADFAAALQPSAERYFEAVTQGQSFLDAIRGAWGCAKLELPLSHLDGAKPPSLCLSPLGERGRQNDLPAREDSRSLHPISPKAESSSIRSLSPRDEGWGEGGLVELALTYPIAAGAVTAAHEIRLLPALEAFALAFASNQISAAIRVSIIGQTAGQRILAALLPAMSQAALRASTATLDDIGGASFSADLCSIEHETQYTRLFRT